MNTIAALITGSGLLILLLSIPLILRRVPPNALYGVRTRASFHSESDWYRINQLGGRYLAVSSLIIIVTGVVGFFMLPSSQVAYSTAATVVTLLSVLIPCIRLCLMRPEGGEKTRRSR